MKIIVSDYANARLEILDVPEAMLQDDTEQFLAAHGYSLNNISWMAAPIDFIPLRFHKYGICQEDGTEEHEVQEARLTDCAVCLCE